MSNVGNVGNKGSSGFRVWDIKGVLFEVSSIQWFGCLGSRFDSTLNLKPRESMGEHSRVTKRDTRLT